METIKVKVYAPGFCDHSKIDDGGFVELEGTATLRDLYRIIKMPLIWGRFMIVRVNYEKVRPGRVLKNNDIVSIFIPINGG